MKRTVLTSFLPLVLFTLTTGLLAGCGTVGQAIRAGGGIGLTVEDFARNDQVQALRRRMTREEAVQVVVDRIVEQSRNIRAQDAIMDALGTGYRLAQEPHSPLVSDITVDDDSVSWVWWRNQYIDPPAAQQRGYVRVAPLTYRLRFADVGALFIRTYPENYAQVTQCIFSLYQAGGKTGLQDVTVRWFVKEGPFDLRTRETTNEMTIAYESNPIHWQIPIARPYTHDKDGANVLAYIDDLVRSSPALKNFVAALLVLCPDIRSVAMEEDWRGYVFRASDAASADPARHARAVDSDPCATATLANLLARHRSRTVAVIPDIPVYKLSRSITACRVPREETVLALIDSTPGGTAQHGMILTDRALYVNNPGNSTRPGRHRLSYAEMANAPIANQGAFEVSIGPVTFLPIGFSARPPVLQLLTDLQHHVRAMCRPETP